MTFDDIFQNAKDLQGELSARSDEIEEAQHIPADVLQRLSESGVFRMCMPEDWGGPELTSAEQVAVIEELSRGDASVGWCATVGSDSGICSGFLDDRVARDIYPHLDVIQGGSVFASGVAEAEMRLGGVRSHVYSALDSQWRQLSEGRLPTAQQRADVWLSRLNAFQSAREICRILSDMLGPASVSRGVIDRALRDTQTMCQHIVGHTGSLEGIGGLLLDPDSDSGLPMA